MDRRHQRRLNKTRLRVTGVFVVFAALATVTSIAAEPIAILVETQKGKPIEGAVITVRAGEGGESVASAVSSDEGVAVVHELGNGEWYFEIDRPGYMLYTAYVLVRIGKKPELGFASQVSRGDDWEPMRVKIRKASTKLVRRAAIATPPEPRVRQTVRVEPQDPAPEPEAQDPETTAETESRPDQREVADPAPEPSPAEVETVTVPSAVETVEPETVEPDTATSDTGAPPELTVADGDPEPLAEVGDEGEPTPETAAQPEESAATIAEPAAEPTADTAEETAPAPAEAPDGAPAETPSPDPDVAADPPAQPEPVAEPEAEAAASTPTESQSPDLPTDVTTAAPTPPATVDAAPETDTKPTLTSPVPASFDPAMTRFLRSAAAGDCPECGDGEWAVSASVLAATAGDTRSTSICADDLGQRAAGFAERLANRLQQPFAGPLMAALWRTDDDAQRAELAEIGTGMLGPEGYCQVAGVVLPAGATMTGYSLEAWDELGGRACSADGICALPKAGWSGRPTVVSGDQATVIYSIFRNRSTRHERNAQLTVLFTPPTEWQ